MMKRFPKVYKSEELLALEAVKELRGEGKWIPVLDCKVVQSSVINAKAETAVRLLDKQDRRTKG